MRPLAHESALPDMAPDNAFAFKLRQCLPKLAPGDPKHAAQFPLGRETPIPGKLTTLLPSAKLDQ